MFGRETRRQWRAWRDPRVRKQVAAQVALAPQDARSRAALAKAAGVLRSRRAKADRS
jgi:hypothetical protein